MSLSKQKHTQFSPSLYRLLPPLLYKYCSLSPTLTTVLLLHQKPVFSPSSEMQRGDKDPWPTDKVLGKLSPPGPPSGYHYRTQIRLPSIALRCSPPSWHCGNSSAKQQGSKFSVFVQLVTICQILNPPSQQNHCKSQQSVCLFRDQLGLAVPATSGNCRDA